MKEIKLTQGQVALVDDDIYPLLSTMKWCALLMPSNKRFYPVRSSNGELQKLYWYVIGHGINGFVVDHIDGNPLNNQRANLRLVPFRENYQNTKRHRGGLPVGVSFYKPRKVWRARITIDKKVHYLGYFKEMEMAAAAYWKANNKFVIRNG